MKAKASFVKTILGRLIFKRFDLPRFFRWVFVLILYLITFSALDQLAHTLQLYPGVVAWYPPDGLSLAFLLTFGAGFTPVFVLASLFSSLFIYHFSTPLGPILVWAVILSAVYGMEAVLLRRRVRIDPELKALRDTLWLILTSAVAATILAVISVSVLIQYGEIPAAVYFNAVAEWWIGEMTGIVVFTPFLLVHAMPWVRRFINGELRNSKKQFVFRRPSLQSIGQVISIPVILYITFGIPALGSFEPYYLMAVPLIWIALKNGFSKVSLAIVGMNFGTVLAIWLFKFDTAHLGELQFLTLGIYASTLLTGAIITQQKRTQEELRQSEEKYRDMVNTVNDGIFASNDRGILMFANQALARIHGFERPEELVGRTFLEFIAPAMVGNITQSFIESLQGGTTSETIEAEIIRPNGTGAFIEIKPVPFVEDGKVTGVRGVVRDITARKQAEEVLAQERNLLRSLIDHVPDLIYVKDAQSRFLIANPALARLTGVASPDELIGKTDFDFFPQELAAKYYADEQAIFQSGQPVLELEEPWVGAADNRRWLSSTKILLRNAQGKIIELVGQSRDITERKQAEAALRESEERYAVAVRGANDGIWDWNLKTNELYYSPRWKSMLGYEESEIGISPDEWFKRVHPDDVMRLKAELNAHIKGDAPLFQSEYRMLHKNGQYLWMLSRGLAVRDAEGNVHRLAGSQTDITLQKQAEQEIGRLAKFPSENPNPVLRLSRDGLLMYANTASEAFLSMWDCEVGGPVPEFWRDLANQALATKENKTVDIVCDGKDYSMFVAPVAEPGYVNVYGRDVTESKQAEEANRETQARFEGIVNMAVEGIISIDESQRVILFNQGAERIFGYSAAEALGLPLVEFLPLSSAELHHRLVQNFGATDDEQSRQMSKLREIQGRRLGGMLFPAEVNISKVTVKGKIIYTAIVRDITLRIQAEEEIKISNDELSMLFELSHSMANADKLDDILDLVNRHAVESIHTTFARIALFEDGNYIIRAAYPIRAIGNDFGIGERYPVNSISSSPHILEQNEPMILRASDPGISNEEKKVLLLDFAQLLCLIPLRISDSAPNSENLIGLLMLGETRNEAREPFTPEKMRLARTIGDSAAIAIRRMLLREQTERRLHQLMALSEIDLAILSSSDMVFSLGVLLSQVIEQLRVDAVDIWLFNPTSQMLEFVSGRGFRTLAFEHGEPLHLGEGDVGQAALERRTIHVPNLTAHDVHPRLKKALAEEPFISYFAVPLIVKEQVKGVLELFQRTELEPNDEWLNFLYALANQAAIAIDNSSLFKDLQESNIELTQAYDATIQGWSRALDLRDKETEGHTQRVTELTIKLGRQFGLSENELVHLRRGALLHDIGKMGVPDAILLKPGSLTDGEWIMMRKHPAFAYEMLSPIHYLQSALDIPYCHHEKWDGTGYPRGLSGDQIPFAARIFAVVDVWDALTSDRPYRAAWPEEKVLDHIRSLAGTHFDPQVAKVCLELGLLSGQKRL